MLRALQLILLFVLLVAVANVVRVNSHLLASSPTADDDATIPAFAPPPRRRMVRTHSFQSYTQWSFHFPAVFLLHLSIPILSRQKSRHTCFSLTPSLPPSLSPSTPPPTHPQQRRALVNVNDVQGGDTPPGNNTPPPPSPPSNPFYPPSSDGPGNADGVGLDDPRTPGRGGWGGRKK